MREGWIEKRFDEVFITLDKMDKIGLDGVKEELLERGFDAPDVEKYLGLFTALEDAGDGISCLAKMLGEYLDEEIVASMKEIETCVNASKNAEFELVFDPTLVRGMSYYTGTIFEIAIPEFGGSCGGGGRYDKMIGKFTGNDVPACGFSIGFERIVLLLMESGFKVPTNSDKIAFLIEKGCSADKMSEIMKEAGELRKEGKTVLVSRMNKNKKFQKEQLEQNGYTQIKEFFNR